MESNIFHFGIKTEVLEGLTAGIEYIKKLIEKKGGRHLQGARTAGTWTFFEFELDISDERKAMAYVEENVKKKYPDGIYTWGVPSNKDLRKRLLIE